MCSDTSQVFLPIISPAGLYEQIGSQYTPATLSLRAQCWWVMFPMLTGPVIEHWPETASRVVDNGEIALPKRGPGEGQQGLSGAC